MTAKIYQIRDFQNKCDIERLYAEFAHDCSLAASIAPIPHDREMYESSLAMWTLRPVNIARRIRIARDG